MIEASGSVSVMSIPNHWLDPITKPHLMYSRSLTLEIFPYLPNDFKTLAPLSTSYLKSDFEGTDTETSVFCAVLQKAKLKAQAF